jgi:hypothetical protein
VPHLGVMPTDTETFAAHYRAGVAAAHAFHEEESSSDQIRMFRAAAAAPEGYVLGFIDGLTD